MNYLAHIALASASGETMVGAVLGDFVKQGLETYPPAMAREIRLHRLIDSFTDRHPLVSAARARFAPERRRYAGIALDVFYDHALSLQWEQHCREARTDLITRFYAALAEHEEQLPERLRLLAPHMAAHDWLGAYASFEGVEIALTRMARRLSRHGERLTACLADLRADMPALLDDFTHFFPELQAFAAARRADLIEQSLQQ